MKRIAVKVAGVVAALLFIAGCQQNTSLETVRIAEVTRSLFYTPQYVAIEKGFFKEEGLDIELTTTWGGDKTMTTLLSNGADIALVGSETSIYVYAQEPADPVINFAQLTQTDGTFLVSREKRDNFSWEDVKGTTFLGQRKGGMPQMAGEYVLRKNGIDPAKDLELIQNVDFANIPTAFSTGTGDFVQLFEPTASLFEKTGVGHIVASFGAESGLLPYTTFMSKQSFIKENKDTVAKFTKALQKAQSFVATADISELASLVQPYFEDTELALIETVIERYRSQGSFATDPLLDEKEWSLLQTIMDESGELPQRVEHDVLVNTDFANTVKAK